MASSSLIHALSPPKFYGPLMKAPVVNATIAYYRFGNGSPLVLIPGHGNSMTTWHPELLRKLSKTHEVIIFDFPGIGQSKTQGQFSSTIAQFAQLTDNFIKNQKLKKVDMLGFSMGGSILLYMASKNSDNYNHIIAVGGKAGGKETVLPQAKYFKMLDNTKLSPERAVKTLLFPNSAENKANNYLKALSQIPQETMNPLALKGQAAAVNAENQGPGIWTQLKNINNKTLILNGTDDILTPVKNAELISNSIDGSWLVRIKGAGHGVLFQDPDFCAKLINLFLSY